MWLPPLLIVPLIIYNIFGFGLFGTPDWSSALFTIPMVSGANWSLTWSDLLVLVALVALFVEVLKSTQTNARSVIDHMLSTVVFVIFLVEFLVVQPAATSLFFICMAMSLIDVVAGFSVSIRAAGRDVNFG